jgi:hypothetical protein
MNIIFLIIIIIIIFTYNILKKHKKKKSARYLVCRLFSLVSPAFSEPAKSMNENMPRVLPSAFLSEICWLWRGEGHVLSCIAHNPRDTRRTAHDTRHVYL